MMEVNYSMAKLTPIESQSGNKFNTTVVITILLIPFSNT